jgi:hypothetical protein
VLNGPIGALADLQIGRAYAIQGDTVKAKAAYQDFLTLWKDGDPDIPVLIEAKAEYAKLKYLGTTSEHLREKIVRNLVDSAGHVHGDEKTPQILQDINRGEKSAFFEHGLEQRHGIGVEEFRRLFLCLCL